MRIPLSPLRRTIGRTSYDTDRDESHTDDHRHFERLLAPPSSTPRPSVSIAATATLATVDNGRPPPACPSCAPPNQAMLRHSSPNSLRLRLTNGPLAGLDIESSRHANGLLIRLRAHDLEPFQRQIGSAQRLTQLLTQQFDRPITVEVLDADTTIE